jgi:hypothetical protein
MDRKMKKISISLLVLFLLFSTLSPAHSAVDLSKLKTHAEKGDAKYQAKLGEAYHKGRGIQQDFKKALFWYKKAAEQGYARGQRPLGVMYEMGKGTPVDLKQAAYWYQKAAAQGLPRAQVNLGILYEAGHGVEQSYDKAHALYLKAEELGYSRGVNQLGLLYEKGLGVPKDINQAISLYEKAAKGKYSKSMFNLGRLYEDKHDLETASQWYKKAVEVGYAAASLDLKRVKESRAKEVNEQKVPPDPPKETKVAKPEQPPAKPVSAALPTLELEVKLSSESDSEEQDPAKSTTEIKEIAPQKSKITSRLKLDIPQPTQPILPLPTNDQKELTIEKTPAKDIKIVQQTAQDLAPQKTALPHQAAKSKPSHKSGLSPFLFTVIVIFGNLILVWLFWSFMLKKRGEKIRVKASSALISELEMDIKGIRKEVEELRDHIDKNDNNR